MKTLSNIITEEQKKIKLPYTFDIYNEGAKNADFKITKKVIHDTFFKIDKASGYHYDSMLVCPVIADKIVYKEFPTKSTTDDWKKLPEINDAELLPVYPGKRSEGWGWDRYNAEWTKYLRMLKPFMKGKVSVTLKEADKKHCLDGYKYLELVINDDKFNADREAKLKELSDKNNLKTWAEEADAKEKAEIEKRAKEEAERKERQERWNTWWKGLSDSDRLAYSMGYGRGSGSWTGD